MTTLGRQRRDWRQMAFWLALWAVLATGLWQAGNVRAATTELIVTDQNTGLAIFGFDPVAYFTDGRAKPGREDLEVSYGGAAWRFANEGNRAAFAADPDVYMPQFGGYDPTAIADGVARPGHPEYFAIHNQRLYLFYSADAKRAFTSDPEGAVLQADANWPDASRTLSP